MHHIDQFKRFQLLQTSMIFNLSFLLLFLALFGQVSLSKINKAVAGGVGIELRIRWTTNEVEQLNHLHNRLNP
jgi:hypothetical protein